ncbi:MAG: HD domain-containing protein [Rickettsiales bacterium]
MIDKEALEFCKKAHGEQKRKYTGEPYWTHPLAVAKKVSIYNDDNDVIIAALLHDVIEDTEIGYEEIKDNFGKKVADLVLEVSDISKPEDGNRAKRKEIDRQHLAKSSPQGATIKLADLIHNTESIVKYDKGFAKIYLVEKEKCLNILKHGNSNLWDEAYQTLTEAKKTVGLSEN